MKESVKNMNEYVEMDKDDYTKKVESYIMENGYQLMDKYPTKKYQTKIKDVLNENGVSMSERTTAMNPIAPKLKGLVKLHKEARPMRPLVNCIQSPYLQNSENCCRVLERKLSV